MTRVTVSKLGDDGDDVAVGTIGWDGTSIHLDPPGDPLLRSVAEDGDPVVTDPETGRVVTPGANPAAWLAGLHRAYASPYLRASKPQDSDAPELGPELAAAVLELKGEGRDAEADELVRLSGDPTAAAAVAAHDQHDAAAGGPPADTFR